MVVASCALAGVLHAAPVVVDDHFELDQFGYLPAASKVAVIARPAQGYNAPDPYVPAAQVEVRRWDDDGLALVTAATPWNGGAVHAQSGDRAWWVDFSSLTLPGSYYLHDAAAGRSSGRFEIDQRAYREVLKHALRSFYYQRCGTAKPAAYSGASWADAACHVGAEQDRDCRSVLDTSAATSRDLSGGWHDAGDYNKYVNFTDDPVHDLLAAYENDPEAFTDDLGLPLSGNGLPDVIDELKYQLDWFLRMQQADGSVLHKVSVTDFSAASPPSRDTAPRRYAPSTASATISACGAFAHGAIVFGAFADPSMQVAAAQLESAAVAAWSWLESNPGSIPSAYDNAGFVNASAEDDAYAQATNRLCAAAYLFALTGDAAYRQYFDARYTTAHLVQWGYAYPFEGTYQDGLLHYSRAPGATPAVVAAIEGAYAASMSGTDNLAHVRAGEDAYRAWLADADYTWGSNRTKSVQGCMYLSMNVYGLDAGNADEYEDAAAGYLHYLHGRNPNGLVYLSAMEPFGAERSCTQFYHSWFADGTSWDSSLTSTYGPAPGFLPGGPNPSFQPDPAYGGPPLEPPENQPIQKSYRDWNAGWPENSWEVTENQCAYQAAYVRLLAAFLPAPPPPPSVSGPSDASACVGAAVTLSVVATGQGPFTYQWRKDGGDVAGATADRLVFTAVARGDAGTYDVLVTDAVGGVTTSRAARVSVRDLPGSPGSSLRVAKSATDVVLTWQAGVDADAHDVERCDASAGPCALAPVASAPAPAYIDLAPPERVVWYQVAATNACGRAR